MATYKVLQDIEAEDKLVGPLTLKQFIFAIVFVAIGFVEFKLLTNNALSAARWPFVIALLFPLIIFGFLAAPISRDQPNDVWLLARIRYFVKPHRRIWNQDGISQLVTITAPKRLEHLLTNGLNQIEVKSRLQALASTLDSRGWATKNVDVNMFAQPGYLATDDGSDRLVAPSTLPVTQATVDIQAADDMMDARSNPAAQQLDKMMQESSAAHKQQVIDSVQNRTQPGPTAATNDYWFLNQPSPGAERKTPEGMATFQSGKVFVPGTTMVSSIKPTTQEEALLARIEAEKALGDNYHSHLKTIQPLPSQTHLPHSVIPTQTPTSDPTATSRLQPTPTATAPPAAPLTYQPASPGAFSTPLPPPPQPTQNPSNTSAPTPNPAILSLANNDDLNVATIARQAQRISESDDEVVIPLH